ncbi:MAG: hypothetical protein R2796_06150 [Chitinophagaceae bacterium]
MKKLTAPVQFLLLTLLAFCLVQCQSADKKSTDSGEEGTGTKTEKVSLVDVLQQKLDTATTNAFEKVIANAKDDPVAIQYLGHYAYLNRQLPVAAWLYALAKEKKPDDVNNISNLAVCLHEMAAADSSGASNELLNDAINLLKNAATQVPGNAAVQNNLGYAYYQQYENSGDSTILPQAETAIRAAIAIDPENAIFYSHLADIKKAENKPDEAVEYLNKAFSITPYDGVFLHSSDNFAPFAAATNSRGYCDSINFNCLKNCPPSIIGRIKVINCEMAQQDALLACKAGKPYAKSYNCDDEIPATGFMIPGLQSGVGIITPWGKLGILVQGGGNIDVKADVNTPVPGISFSGGGRYNPSSGMSKTYFGANVSVNLYDKGIVSPVLNKLGLGPAGVKVSVSTKDSENGIKLESLGTTVVHYH